MPSSGPILGFAGPLNFEMYSFPTRSIPNSGKPPNPLIEYPAATSLQFPHNPIIEAYCEAIPEVSGQPDSISISIVARPD